MEVSKEFNKNHGVVLWSNRWHYVKCWSCWMKKYPHAHRRPITPFARRVLDARQPVIKQDCTCGNKQEGGSD